MNDLGWTLGWLAAQVALLLVPAIGFHTLASRRGPTSGAWVATLSLGMVVLLALLAFLPGSNGGPVEVEALASPSAIDRPAEVAKVEPPGSAKVTDRAGPSEPTGRPFAEFRLAWRRFERQAAGPVARFRPWGKAVALASLAGSGFGLVRLLVGLWAVGLCRKRGKLVDDPVMVGLVDELRRAMGCGPSVELREVADLTTPATAGWLRPMLLLPGDWRGWDNSDRRAVVAHELAHIIRGDYASSLLARVAVVLNYYHPMVRWLAGRLHLEQELAADAMGASFAGGRSSYLLALSRLALEQDGRPASWPARAFLPARGTLIRRIKMLKNDQEWNGQSWSKARRLATALGLLALTLGVASVKAPANAADDKVLAAPPADPKVKADDARAVVEPFETRYLPDAMNGAVAFRPAAITRRVGINTLKPLIRAGLGGDPLMLADRLGVDTSRPGFVKFGVEDIESITSGFSITKPDGDPKNAQGESLHALAFGGVTVRTVKPFDWPAFFRQWTMEPVEVKEHRGVYYKLKDPAKAEIMMGCVFFQPDNRTLVIEGEARVKELIAREAPASPAYLRDADWHRAADGLLAVAINNKGDSFTKGYDLGRPDDKVVLSLFQGVDRWIFDVPDIDAIDLVGLANARDPNFAESVARSIQGLVRLGSTALDAMMAPKEDLPETGVQADAFRIYKGFLTKLEVTTNGSLVVMRVQGDNLGKFTDLAAILKMELGDAMSRANAEAEAEEAKAKPKAEKR